MGHDAESSPALLLLFTVYSPTDASDLYQVSVNTKPTTERKEEKNVL